MGREERAKQKKRLLEWGGSDLDARAFELTYEALAVFRPERDDEDRAAGLLEQLDGIGKPKGETSQNSDLVLRTLDGAAQLEVTEAARDLLLKAIRAVRFPAFALRKKQRAVEIIENAEPVEQPGPVALEA